MTLPVFSKTIDEAFRSCVNEGRRKQPRVARIRTKAAAGTSTDRDLWDIVTNLDGLLIVYNENMNFNGLNTYSKDAWGISNLVWAQETDKIVTDAAALRDWVVANIDPPSQNPISLTSEETAGFQTLALVFEADFS